ncbi:hypothetical protein PENSPDRAFT_446711 [Peniophora sp. CONT]|nr:hypothetical protein PENSPDRAFT_446711 [Peniophora sp. CONT]
MSVSPKHVRVAYQFSISPKSDGYQHLSTEDQWKKLFISASDAISRTTSKKPFVVVIKDLNLEAGKGKGKGGSASAGGRRNAKKVGSKRKRDSTDESSSDDALEKSTRERDTSQKPKSALQWKVRLERDLHCVEHNRPCVKIDGTCYPIQHDEMSHWSLFCANGYPSTTSPPPKLVIKAAADRNGGSGGRQGQKTASATPATTAGPGSNPTNVQAPPAPVMGGFYPMAQMHMGYGMAAPPAPYMPPYPPFPYGPWSGYEPHRGSPYRTRDGRDIRDRDLSLSPHRSRGLRRDPYDIPGSDPIEDDAEDPSAFPLLTEWLAGLDQHPQRGIDQHNFGQFADEFTQKKYYRILDLEDKSAKDIRLSICPGMVEGTADKLARYIKQDLAAIRKKLRNMARQESSQRSGYY